MQQTGNKGILCSYKHNQRHVNLTNISRTLNSQTAETWLPVTIPTKE